MSSIRCLHLAEITLPVNHPRSSDGTCQIYGYVIDHPDGAILIDTGTRAGHAVIDELYAPVVTSIIDALNDAGFDERDVTAIVNTHLHFDHCGQNHLLPHSNVWVTEAEVEASKADLYTVPDWAHIEPERLRVSSDNETIADGVRLLHTPGHTPGHQSIAVDTDNGLEIIVGQACYTCAEYTAAEPAPTDMHDLSWHTTGVESIARIHALRPRRAHFSHDRTTYAAS